MLRIVALRLMYCRGLALYFSHGFPSFCCYPYSHLDLLVLSKPREVFCKGLVKNTLQIASRRSYAEGTGPGQCRKPGFREYFIRDCLKRGCWQVVGYSSMHEKALLN